ncbi:MAG: hypothetical protein BWK73_37160 [Thiothrix lacustris]|uniref:Alpha-galactosidase NEW3 domain-containing protein n=1 Tax=Thiothrix lacustris TaxID=525917 RepID=A0A1Y1QFF3_9GAMM|nr:MAG: hypothetical protein BWK73_37160 [Thiothrix lacustris]
MYKSTPAHPSANSGAIRLALAASLLMLAQAATAADEINITPGQRQITVTKPGVVTLRFEVENRSGQTQQLQENLTLPEGWELLTNTTPFLLANGSREVRLIHVVAPRGTGSGAYRVQYAVSAQDGGSISGSQSVTIQMEEQAGIRLSAAPAPSSLLGGEQYEAEFILENTGNHQMNYTLSGRDEEGYITAVEPRKLKLAAGASGSVKVKGKIPRNLDETTQYKVALEAQGGGKQAEASVTIPLISRVTKGASKYQTLPGRLTTRQTQQKRQLADGTETQEQQTQVEYNAAGAIDKNGKHRVGVRVRNGKNSTTTGTTVEQQADYQLNYDNDEVAIKTGHQGFGVSGLSGNALSGIGAEAVYTPQNTDKQQPLEMRAFTGQSRSGDTAQEKVSGAAVSYQWDEYDTSASVIQNKKQATATQPATQQTVAAVKGAWRGEKTGVRTEIAADDDAVAWSVDANGQWQSLSTNVSALQAGAKFDGGSTNTQQAFANARYQIDEQTSADISTRRTRNNLDNDPTKEIRQDQEHQARLSRTFGENKQIEVSLGHRQRKEKDLRAVATTDQDIQSTTLDYTHRFDSVQVSASTEQGKRTDRIKASGKGSKHALAVNWQPSKDLSANVNYALNDGLDSSERTTTAGVNTTYRLNRRATVSGYAQRNNNANDQSHADSLEVKYSHDLKDWGSIATSARRVDNAASDGKITHDNTLAIEYSLPLDMPIRVRDDIGSVQGKVHFAADQRPAKDIVVQMDGAYAITDENGEFRYPNVPAKEYRLQVDSTRPNTQGYMLSADGAEAVVSVQPKQTANLKLGLHSAARVSGTLQAFIPDAQAALGNTNAEGKAALKADKGLGMVLLELQPVGEIGKRITYRRTTLHDGSFSFAGIPPGQWQLVVADTNRLPANYRMEQNQFMVDLSQGDNKELLIRALPTAEGIKKVGPAGGFSVTG